ncbi:MAG: alpha/beta hydrolase family esterase [Methylococcales bacterium]
MKRFRWIGFLVPGALICVPVLADLQRGLSLSSDGLERTYDLFVPQTTGKEPLPLVLMVHGYYGDADVMTGKNGRPAPYKVWLRLAERDRFLVAIPNGEKGPDHRRGWNDCRADAAGNPSTDDVAFTLSLLDRIAERYAVDRQRVYAVGTSNGGSMVQRLALETPERFAAVASAVSAMPKINQCRTSCMPIPILYMNGTEDPLLPYAGGQVGKDSARRGQTASTRDSIAYWVEVNRANRLPERHEFPDRTRWDRSTVVRERYARIPGGADVVLYEVRGGGHTEPSPNERYGFLYQLIVGNQNQDIEMAEEIWAFFKGKRRGGLSP